MAKPRFEIIQTLSGENTLRDLVLQEKFHPAGPIYEAQEIYIKQSKLKEKLRLKPQVVFDIGLGAASNSIAAYEAAVEAKSNSLTILSFEFDLEILDFAFQNKNQFSHIERHKHLLAQLLKNKFYQDNFVQWRIIEGDLTKTINLDYPAPDIIFHDPYSPALNPNLWGVSIFNRYFELCKNKQCTLITYSQATRIRAALLNAGFFVGHGLGLGMKRESTVASTNFKELELPLNNKWPLKWQRSSCGYPVDISLIERENFGLKIANHSQFLNVF
ncbi:MAG: hypothetical protein IPM57_12425 [Oligoflexia bacterium]|nr:hypothetical protein [Oligoflexia bacterium]